MARTGSPKKSTNRTLVRMPPIFLIGSNELPCKRRLFFQLLFCSVVLFIERATKKLFRAVEMFVRDFLEPLPIHQKKAGKRLHQLFLSVYAIDVGSGTAKATARENDARFLSGITTRRTRKGPFSWAKNEKEKRETFSRFFAAVPSFVNVSRSPTKWPSVCCWLRRSFIIIIIIVIIIIAVRFSS